MLFNKNGSATRRETSSSPQPASISVLGRVARVLPRLSWLGRGPSSQSSPTTAPIDAHSEDELNDSDSESDDVNTTDTSSANTSAHDLSSEPQSTGLLAHTESAEVALSVDQDEYSASSPVPATPHTSEAVAPQRDDEVVNPRDVTPDSIPASVSEDFTQLQALASQLTSDSQALDTPSERGASPGPASPSSSTSCSQSSDEAPGLFVPNPCFPLRPLDPRSYGGFHRERAYPVPEGYHGVMAPLPPTWQKSMPHGLTRQKAYSDVRYSHRRHGLRREEAVHEDTHPGIRPRPTEEWWIYQRIRKDGADNDEGFDPDSDSSSGSSKVSYSPRTYTRARAPSPPSPGRVHNVSDSDGEGRSTSSRSGPRRPAPYPSPSPSPSPSMYRNPNPQNMRAKVEARREQASRCPSPAPATCSTPRTSGPERRRKLSPRASPYPSPSSSTSAVDNSDDQTSSLVRRSARISAAKSTASGKGKARELNVKIIGSHAD